MKADRNTFSIIDVRLNMVKVSFESITPTCLCRQPACAAGWLPAQPISLRRRARARPARGFDNYLDDFGSDINNFLSLVSD